VFALVHDESEVRLHFLLVFDIIEYEILEESANSDNEVDAVFSFLVRLRLSLRVVHVQMEAVQKVLINFCVFQNILYFSQHVVVLAVFFYFLNHFVYEVAQFY
jgi:hypothetical protein